MARDSGGVGKGNAFVPHVARDPEEGVTPGVCDACIRNEEGGNQLHA